MSSVTSSSLLRDLQGQDRIRNKYLQLRIAHGTSSNGGAGRAFWEQRGERKNYTEWGKQAVREGCVEEACLPCACELSSSVLN